MSQAIFFSGVHGSGKTTTLKLVAEDLNFPIFQGIGDAEGNPVRGSVFRRQAYRLGKYFSDTFHIEESLKDSDLLVDRCIYDWIAYTETFHRIGWISDAEHQKLEAYLAAFSKDLLPKNVIWFDPEYYWIEERIAERSEEEGEKWKEEDKHYLKTLHEVYREIYIKNQPENLLHLTNTDREERRREVGSFIKGLAK